MPDSTEAKKLATELYYGIKREINDCLKRAECPDELKMAAIISALCQALAALAIADPAEVESRVAMTGDLYQAFSERLKQES